MLGALHNDLHLSSKIEKICSASSSIVNLLLKLSLLCFLLSRANQKRGAGIERLYTVRYYFRIVMMRAEMLWTPGHESQCYFSTQDYFGAARSPGIIPLATRFFRWDVECPSHELHHALRKQLIRERRIVFWMAQSSISCHSA